MLKWNIIKRLEVTAIKGSRRRGRIMCNGFGLCEQISMSASVKMSEKIM